MIRLGALHGTALGTAFQKEHSSLQQRRLRCLIIQVCSDSDRIAGALKVQQRPGTTAGMNMIALFEGL